MYKYIIIVLIFCSLASNAIAQNSKILGNELKVAAQNRNTMAKEITNKMLFVKKGHEKRQIEFWDSIHSKPFLKGFSKNNIIKDSLRIQLIKIGFCDYNFDCFELKLKNLNELNESFIKSKNPQLFELLSNSTYNKVTYSFQESVDGIDLSLVLSDNQIVIDNIATIESKAGPGINSETISYTGFSRKTGIIYCEGNTYSSLMENRKNQKRNIKLDANNRFKITVNNVSYSEKYIGIEDQTGKILSIIRKH